MVWLDGQGFGRKMFGGDKKLSLKGRGDIGVQCEYLPKSDLGRGNVNNQVDS